MVKAFHNDTDVVNGGGPIGYLGHHRAILGRKLSLSEFVGIAGVVTHKVECVVKAKNDDNWCVDTQKTLIVLEDTFRRALATNKTQRSSTNLLLQPKAVQSCSHRGA